MFKDLKSKIRKRLRPQDSTSSAPMDVQSAPEVEAFPATRDEIFLALLSGVHDAESPLSALRGIPHVIKLIFTLATNEYWWKKCIVVPDFELDAEIVRLFLNHNISETRKLCKEKEFLFLTELSKGRHPNPKKDRLEFPPPKDININMMPFILAKSFKHCKLPNYLKPYWPFIERCATQELNKALSPWFDTFSSHFGKVCYLTINESLVDSGETQRRPGLHVDCPGHVTVRPATKRKAKKKNADDDAAFTTVEIT